MPKIANALKKRLRQRTFLAFTYNRLRARLASEVTERTQLTPLSLILHKIGQGTFADCSLKALTQFFSGLPIHYQPRIEKNALRVSEGHFFLPEPTLRTMHRSILAFMAPVQTTTRVPTFALAHLPRRLRLLR